MHLAVSGSRTWMSFTPKWVQQTKKLTNMQPYIFTFFTYMIYHICISHTHIHTYTCFHQQKQERRLRIPQLTTGHWHWHVVPWFVCWWLVWVFIEVWTFRRNTETPKAQLHHTMHSTNIRGFGPSNPWGWESTKTSRPSLNFDRSGSRWTKLMFSSWESKGAWASLMPPFPGKNVKFLIFFFGTMRFLFRTPWIFGHI